MKEMLKPMITNVAYYVPILELTNTALLELYSKQYNKDITKLLESTGKDKRRICLEHESILTMAEKSTKDAIAKAGLKIEDIDMIVFSTGTPEFIQPCNAIKLHRTLGCKKEVLLCDMNASCVGMLVALTHVNNTMLANKKIKNAVVIGAEQFFSFTHESEVVPYSVFGESACTLLMQNVEVESDDNGLLDFSFYTDSRYCDCIQLPPKGMKHTITKDNLLAVDKMVAWDYFNLDATHGSASKSIDELLKANNIDKSDVKMYFCSQFTKTGLDRIADELQEDINKFKYIGDRFGYTGTTSPFIALADAIEKNEIHKGDYILFWSVGSGFTCHTSIFRL